MPHTGKSAITCMGSNFQPITPKHGVRCRYVGVGSGSVLYTMGNMSADGSKAVCPTPSVDMASGTWPYLLALSFNFEGNPSPQWSGDASISIFTSPIINRTAPVLISSVGGTSITLIGFNFKDTPTAACRFGSGVDTSVLARFRSPTQIECVMPAVSNKSPTVALCVTINGVDCSDNFNLRVYAVVQLFPPAVPLNGGLVNVTMNAAHPLGEIPADLDPRCEGNLVCNTLCSGLQCVRCRFRATDGWIQYGSVSAIIGNVIVCSAPIFQGRDQSQGPQQLALSLNFARDWEGSASLHVYPIPVVASTLPCSGPVSGATVVTLRGSNFYKADGLLSLCSFGGLRSPATLKDCETLGAGKYACSTAVCSSPSIPEDNSTDFSSSRPEDTFPGQGAHFVSVALLLNSVQPNTVSSFIFYNTPQMVSLHPSACPNAGSSLVTIRGSDLSGGYNGSRFCRFMPAEPSNHELLFLDPQGAAQGAAGMEARKNATLMITGAYYTKPGTELVCPCPKNARVFQQRLNVVVSLNGQQYAGTGLAAVVHAPIELYSTTPLSGDVQGTTLVYASGANFVQGPGLQMIFGVQAVPATVVRQGLIQAYSPASVGMELGKVQIRVSNNNGVDMSPTSTVFEYFSAGLGCPVEKQTQKTCHWQGLEYGTCVANECRCRTGYWGRACSLVPVTVTVFPRSGVPAGGTLVSVRGLFLGGECCSILAEHASTPTPINPQPDAMLKVRESMCVCCVRVRCVQE